MTDRCTCMSYIYVIMWVWSLSVCPAHIDDSMEWEYGVSDTPSPLMKVESPDPAHPPSFPRDPRVKPLVCEECGSDDNSEELLFCRGCDLVYHPLCLLPRVQTTPIGVWYCPSCISKVSSAPSVVTLTHACSQMTSPPLTMCYTCAHECISIDC